MHIGWPLLQTTFRICFRMILDFLTNTCMLQDKVYYCTSRCLHLNCCFNTIFTSHVTYLIILHKTCWNLSHQPQRDVRQGFTVDKRAFMPQWSQTKVPDHLWHWIQLSFFFSPVGFGRGKVKFFAILDWGVFHLSTFQT